MLKRVFVFLLCVSVFLPFLGSCGNPVDILVRDGREDQEQPGDPTQAEDPDEGDSEEDPENEEDPGKEDDSEAGDGPEAGDTQGSGAGQDDGDEPGSQDVPEDGDEPGSGDSEDGSNNDDGDTPGGGPDSGDAPGSGGTPWIGDGPILTGSAAVKEYLDGQEGNTQVNPYHIRVGDINLASAGTGNALKGLYLALSQYVALDLSGSYGEKIVNVSLSSVPEKGRITAIILPPDLTSIELNAFEQCRELVSAILPGVATIARGAFSRCDKLQTLVADEVRKITFDPPSENANGAFHNCDSLVSVSLPKATEIGKKAFNSCDSLSRVYAPQAAFIGDSAFAGCKQLESITLGETPPELGESVFAANKPDVIYVPVTSVDAYKTADIKGWTDELKAKVQAAP